MVLEQVVEVLADEVVGIGDDLGDGLGPDLGVGEVQLELAGESAVVEPFADFGASVGFRMPFSTRFWMRRRGPLGARDFAFPAQRIARRLLGRLDRFVISCLPHGSTAFLMSTTCALESERRARILHQRLAQDHRPLEHEALGRSDRSVDQAALEHLTGGADDVPSKPGEPKPVVNALQDLGIAVAH